MMNYPQTSIQMKSAVDPYMYQMLGEYMGKNIVIQTTRNPIQGVLKSAMPDHVVVDVHGVPFYIRAQEVIWFSPAR